MPLATMIEAALASPPNNNSSNENGYSRPFLYGSVSRLASAKYVYVDDTLVLTDPIWANVGSFYPVLPIFLLQRLITQYT